MTQQGGSRNRVALIAGGTAAMLAAACAAWWMLGPVREVSGLGTRFEVTQSGRRFHPESLSMRREDSLRIVNDDEDLTHHAYITADQFKFDSGDQPPGRDVIIQFPASGTFDVLCGIHPKMRLTVHVY
jgi:plastocyanin